MVGCDYYWNTQVRSIVTMNGELLVDDIRVSSYAGNEAMGVLLHQMVAPIRMVSRISPALGSKICMQLTPMIKKMMNNYLYKIRY